ncbi:hypothetical protein IMCC3317_34310 [Kordia antarctica]|uniref:Uncharacterized protein n=1 Tax=Kordia antarctica TaxID=1218801 RepID=A0A7L4ZNK4_9FLAO|nr:hypothetical protein [Kordia antarctica]QHI38047.1 hypothetical protein IMCC3317_34310 [Kordia antarctica]
MKWRNYMNRFFAITRTVISKSIGGIERVATHIKNGNYSKIIEDVETSLSTLIEKTEQVIKDKSTERIQKKSQRKKFREIGEEQDAIRDFEHVKVSMQRKKERLTEIKALQQLTKEYTREH